MHEKHRERMRERYLKHGISAFQPHEMLEFLLFYGIARVNTNEIAHTLMGKFGSISAVLDAPYEELIKVKGIGENCASLIKFVKDFTAVYIDDRVKDGEIINSTEKAGDFLKGKYFGMNNEAFSLICLDTKGKLLKWQIIHEGSLNAVDINVRKMIEFVIATRAQGVILAHNHPGGVAIPSESDIEVTRNLVKAMNMISVYCIDHIILADNDYISFYNSKKYTHLFTNDFNRQCAQSTEVTYEK